MYTTIRLRFEKNRPDSWLKLWICWKLFIGCSEVEQETSKLSHCCDFYGSRIFRRGSVRRKKKPNLICPNLTETNIFFTTKCHTEKCPTAKNPRTERLSSLRGLRGAPKFPLLCRETSVSRTANVGTVGMNGSISL